MPLKILYQAAFENGVAAEEHYAVRAFRREGHEVIMLNEFGVNSQLIERFIDIHKPDLFLFTKLRCEDWPMHGRPGNYHAKAAAEFCRRISKKTMPVCWWFDLFDAAEYPLSHEWVATLSPALARMFVTDGYTAPQFPNCRVLRQACPDDYRDGKYNPIYACDVSFVGNVVYRSFGDARKIWLDALQIALASHGLSLGRFNGVYGPEACDIMASCKLCIAPPVPQKENYASNRIYVVTGYGGGFVAPENSAYDDGWPENGFWTFSPHLNAANLAEAVAFVIESGDYKKRGATEFCRTYCTYDHRVRAMLAELGLGESPAETSWAIKSSPIEDISNAIEYAKGHVGLETGEG